MDLRILELWNHVFPRLALTMGLGILGSMDLKAAQERIDKAFERMRSAYGKPVFDEWALLSLSEKQGRLVTYSGPRPEQFRQSFSADVGPLRELMRNRSLAEGDFEFALDAGGTHFDAVVRVGPATYLLCNNTAKSMEEIRLDPRWLKAQGIFFELGESFRSDRFVESA